MGYFSYNPPDHQVQVWAIVLKQVLPAALSLLLTASAYTGLFVAEMHRLFFQILGQRSATSLKYRQGIFVSYL